MRLGLIGPGKHGSRYLMPKNGGENIVAILSRSGKPVDHPALHTTDPEEFFAQNLDGVIVATPTETHMRITLEAMRRGCDVLCEKPLSNRWVECEALLNASRALCRRLGVAHTDLFHADMQRLNVGGFNWDSAPCNMLVEFGAPDGELSEWAPHAVAVALHAAGITRGMSWGRDGWEWSITNPFADNRERRCSVVVRHGHKMRRADMEFYGGPRQIFDGTAPSDPTPIRNMLNVFMSGADDRRVSYDFTRAVYRVLLTDSD